MSYRLTRRIELEGAKPTKLRIALIVLALVVAAGAFAAGIHALLDQSSGWQTVEAYPEGVDCSGDFVLQYYLGEGGASDTVSYKKLSGLYTQALEEACAAFYPQGALAAVNASPNEEVTVTPALYRALEQLEAAENRSIYLAPVYALYNQVFLSEDEDEARRFDPMYSEELGAYAAEIAAFASDPDAISLELMGEDRVLLRISEEYLTFASENGIETFLDFGWMTNAFMVDYVAETLLRGGYTTGYLASFDGFTRTLGPEGTSYSLNLFHREGTEIRLPAAMDYAAPMSVVTLRDYPMSEADRWHYFTYSDGSVTTAIIDPMTGLSKSAISDLTACSKSHSCVEILLATVPVFLADEADMTLLQELVGRGISSIHFEGTEVCVLGKENVKLTEDGEAAGYRILHR